MSYIKQNFVDGDVLTAEHVNRIEDAIVELYSFGGGATTLISAVELLAANWQGNASPYSQVVNIAGVTERSQVNLNPTIEQLAVFHDKDLTLVTQNENGVVKVYALGDKPTNDYTIQVSVTEVVV